MDSPQKGAVGLQLRGWVKSTAHAGHVWASGVVGRGQYWGLSVLGDSHCKESPYCWRVDVIGSLEALVSFDKDPDVWVA